MEPQLHLNARGSRGNQRKVNWKRRSVELAERLPTDREAELVEETGVDLDLFRKMCVGLDPRTGQLTIPVHDGAGRVVGLYRWPLCDRNPFEGDPGLILPPGLADMPPESLIGQRLLVATDACDTMRLDRCGEAAIGLPTLAASSELFAFVDRQRPAEVVLLAPGDYLGRSASEFLAAVLRERGSATRLITPPAGIADFAAWQRTAPQECMASIEGIETMEVQR